MAAIFKFFRFLNAPGCELNPVFDDYFHSLFLMYIIIPSVPFFAVTFLLLAGCCGVGFKDIEKIREHLNPFVRTASRKESELQELVF